jgi:uroporphyrinogen-III synthase
MRVAITRAMPEAEITAQRVRELGAEPVIAPLLTIVPCGYDTNTEDAQAIIFTSINGVRAFPATREARARILAVGDATADAARAAGFLDVRSADGDVDALAALAESHSIRPRAANSSTSPASTCRRRFRRRTATRGVSVERRQALRRNRRHPRLPPHSQRRWISCSFTAHAPRDTFVALGAPERGGTHSRLPE